VVRCLLWSLHAVLCSWQMPWRQQGLKYTSSHCWADQRSDCVG
jgi:hypothetical protein